MTAPDWDTELKCDGNEVAVGACSGGGGWGHKDCPGQPSRGKLDLVKSRVRRNSSPTDVLRPPGLHLLSLQHLQQRLRRRGWLSRPRGRHSDGWEDKAILGVESSNLFQRASVTLGSTTTATAQPTWLPAATGSREGRRSVLEKLNSDQHIPWQLGPTAECTWEYSGHGTMLECGRSDEVLVGRWGDLEQFCVGD